MKAYSNLSFKCLLILILLVNLALSIFVENHVISLISSKFKKFTKTFKDKKTKKNLKLKDIGQMNFHIQN